jgi:trigger factor
VRVSTEELPNREVRLTVEVQEERSQEALRQAARMLSRRVRVPGFRPGKAPYGVVLRTVGEETLRSEAFDAIGQTLYEEALAESHTDAFAQGTLEDVTWDPLTFKVTVPLSPAVQLGDYHSLRVAKEPILVLDEDVDSELRQLRERYAEWEPVERAAAYDDMLIMDIRGTVEGEEIISQQNWERVLTQEDEGSLPGFDAALLGMQPGEERSFDLTYPESAKRWPGKTAHFQVMLHGVKGKRLPALDDDLAQMAGEYQTLEELREATRSRLRTEREREQDYRGKVLDALVDQSSIEYAPVMLEREMDDMLEDRERVFQRSGFPLSDFLRMSKKSREQYREELRPQADQRLKRRLALTELVEQEKIAVAESDVDTQIDQRVAEQPADLSAQWREVLSSGSGRKAVRNELITDLALDRLVLIAQGLYVPSAEATQQADAAATEPDEAPKND